MKRLPIVYLAAAICLVMAASCNKDEETTTKSSLSGLYLKGGSHYVAKGTTLDFQIDLSSLTTSGDSMPDSVGVYWQVNSVIKDTLSTNIARKPVKGFSYTADTLGRYTVYCYAFADNNSQYPSTASTTFIAIDPSNSVTGLAGKRSIGQKYLQVSLGGLIWTAENIYETPGGYSYLDCDVMDSVFGRYYSYEDALTACPEGWRLPTQAEWDALDQDTGKLMAEAYFLGDRMWPHCKEVSITNQLGFNAIPAGYFDTTIINDSVSGLNEYAAFWTSDAKDATLAHYRYIFGTYPKMQKGEGSRTSLALSVRCVK
ncbi:MAG: hypothetical protein J5675_04025 [Bacteroidales bacterium]|nr:hypothetical protein [Bacteroidales bacterium]